MQVLLPVNRLSSKLVLNSSVHPKAAAFPVYTTCNYPSETTDTLSLERACPVLPLGQRLSFSLFLRPVYHYFLVTMSTRPAMATRTPSGPSASVPRMIFSPFIRLLRMLNLPIPTNLPTSPSHLITPFVLALTAALQRLDLSRDPRKTFQKIAQHKFTISNVIPLVFMVTSAAYSLYMMNTPAFPPLKYLIVLAYTIASIIPFTGQFVWPASPIFAWLVTFFSARYIPSTSRPKIHVNLLPALESVMYGANISDLQTRFTHPILDVIAWVPYGVLHFAIPFIVALLLWVFGPRGSVQYWGRAFGLMNLIGVVTQILLPCAAPCRSPAISICLEVGTDRQGTKSFTV